MPDDAFWEDEEELMYLILAGLLIAAAVDAAEVAAAALAAETGIAVDILLAREAASAWAANYSYELVKGINATSRAFVSEAISGWIDSAAPMDDLIDELRPMFGPVRAELIAVTETTRAFSEGYDEVWRRSGIIEFVDVIDAGDDRVCPVCQGVVKNNPYTLEDPAGKPPFHGRCRCWRRPRINEGKLAAAMAQRILWSETWNTNLSPALPRT